MSLTDKSRELFEGIVHGSIKGVFVIAIVVAILLAIVIVLGIIAYLIMLLWNYVIPDVVGWKALTFWKAYALMLLCWGLFGRISK
jgi:hypothetical protein